MPPREARQLDPEARDRLIEYLDGKPEADDRLDHAAQSGLLGGAGQKSGVRQCPLSLLESLLCPRRAALRRRRRASCELQLLIPAENRPGSELAISRSTSALEGIMLWTIAVVLLVLWALGLVSSYTMGGFIHLLLVVAVVMVLVNLIGGRRAV